MLSIPLNSGGWLKDHGSKPHLHRFWRAAAVGSDRVRSSARGGVVHRLRRDGARTGADDHRRWLLPPDLAVEVALLAAEENKTFEDGSGTAAAAWTYLSRSVGRKSPLPEREHPVRI